MIRRRRPVSPSFAAVRFPLEVILLAVRWYLRDGLSYRDVEELLAERGVDVDHLDDLSVGATLHTAGHRCRAAVSAQRR